MQEIESQMSTAWKTRLDDEMCSRYTAEGVWRNQTLAMSADHQAETAGEAIAVVEGGRRFSYREIHKQAHGLAAWLSAEGLEPGDVLSFQLPNWYETLVINVAACIGGYICNPIVPIYRDKEVRFILEDSGSKALFVTDAFRSINYIEMLERIRDDLPALEKVVLVRSECSGFNSFESCTDYTPRSPLQANAIDANAVKLLLYTSGTTGNPKGVLHSHNTVQAEVDALEEFWRLSAHDVVLMPSPVTHITGYIYALEFAFALGITAVLMERWDPAEAVRLCDEHGVTFTVGATPFLAELVDELERGNRTLDSLRMFACGGAPVAPSIIRRASSVLPNCQAIRVYGSTEAPTISAGVAPGDPVELGGNTDGCILNHDVKIVDPLTAAPVADGQEGEILTRGPEVMLGYTRWENTAEAFDEEGFFRTGDLGFISCGRYLTISGRKKDLIIRGGENISAKEVEDALHRMPEIREAAVVAMPHPRLGETLAAYAVLRPDRELDLAGVSGWLEEQRLAKQKYPECLVIVDELPRTATGKVLKHVLRARSQNLRIPG